LCTIFPPQRGNIVVPILKIHSEIRYSYGFYREYGTVLNRGKVQTEIPVKTVSIKSLLARKKEKTRKLRTWQLMLIVLAVGLVGGSIRGFGLLSLVLDPHLVSIIA
jgi:hypothetical protein